MFNLKMLSSNTLLVVMLVPATLSLVPTSLIPTCMNNPLDLVPDPDDCHIFYQCDLNPQPMSCGNLMFNSFRQVCDWPSTVLQLRSECRQEEKLRFSSQEYPYHRTLRMLRFFGDGNQFSQKRLRAPQDVGLGRVKNFGNRHYPVEDGGNRIAELANSRNPADEQDIVLTTNNNQKTVEAETNVINQDFASSLQFDIKNQVLQEIRRRLPQILQNNILELPSKQESHKQAVVTKQTTQALSTPADTIRLTLQKIPTFSAPQSGQPIARPKPTAYNEIKTKSASNKVAIDKILPQVVDLKSTKQKDLKIIQHLQAFADATPADTIRLQPQNLAPQGPNYVYEQVYPAQLGPSPTPLKTQSAPIIQPQPQLAPIIVEDTREFKPVWTVTRERPRQILLKYRNHQQTNCVGKNCPRRRQRVLRKIKRKLIVGEKHQLEQRRKELIQGTKAAQKSQNGIARLDGDVKEDLTREEKKAITLKEAYDRAISKVEHSKNNQKLNERPVPGNLLHEILNRDFGGSKGDVTYGEYSSQSYVNSDDLRSEIHSE